MTPSLGLAAVVLLLNLPMGYVRAGSRKFSLPWFVAVHAAVPVVAGLRLLTGIGWRPETLPLFVAAYAAGQFLGGRFRGWRARVRSRR